MLSNEIRAYRSLNCGSVCCIGCPPRSWTHIEICECLRKAQAERSQECEQSVCLCAVCASVSGSGERDELTEGQARQTDKLRLACRGASAAACRHLELELEAPPFAPSLSRLGSRPRGHRAQEPFRYSLFALHKTSEARAVTARALKGSEFSSAEPRNHRASRSWSRQRGASDELRWSGGPVVESSRMFKERGASRGHAGVQRRKSTPDCPAARSAAFGSRPLQQSRASGPLIRVGWDSFARPDLLASFWRWAV